MGPCEIDDDGIAQHDADERSSITLERPQLEGRRQLRTRDEAGEQTRDNESEQRPFHNACASYTGPRGNTLHERRNASPEQPRPDGLDGMIH